MKYPRIAIVYDRINKFGGAERVLLALHELWPDAPIYTAVYDAEKAAWSRGIRVIPSFLQSVPLAKAHHEWFAWLTPMAFESFSFDEFDVVLSVTSAEAKGIITKPTTCHICYCLTPTRYLWSGSALYQKHGRIGMPHWLSNAGLTMSLPTLRRWDTIASKRPDYYIAISETVSERIKRYYGASVRSVVYPPVNTEYFGKRPTKRPADAPDGYYLLVSRLVSYKRADIVIEAFNRLGWPLVVVGEGEEKSLLQTKAGKNIRFVGSVSDESLREYYAYCKALVYAGLEDFGIVAAEALAAGKPVIAYREGGIAEIMGHGKTGLLFAEQSAESLVASLKSAEGQWYDSKSCAQRAEAFSTARFAEEMKHSVQTLYNSYTL